MKLTAAIIAGGHSRRMGRDKALLPHPALGTLLQRQLALVSTLAPDEILISCRPEQSLPGTPAVRRIHDPGTDGPLGGLAALLEAMCGEMLLVLAVDLGTMTAAMLRRLVDSAAPGCGVVPRTARGAEPLAALYPAALAAEARQRLEAGGDRSLQGFVRAGIASGSLRWYEVPVDEVNCFANWNTPDDLPATESAP